MSRRPTRRTLARGLGRPVGNAKPDCPAPRPDGKGAPEGRAPPKDGFAELRVRLAVAEAAFGVSPPTVIVTISWAVTVMVAGAEEARHSPSEAGDEVGVEMGVTDGGVVARVTAALAEEMGAPEVGRANDGRAELAALLAIDVAAASLRKRQPKSMQPQGRQKTEHVDV